MSVNLRLACVVCLLLFDASAFGDEPARTDRVGDPLPPGAVARLGTQRLHGGAVERLAFSPDGKLLASGHGGAISVWDSATGKEVRRLAGHSDRIHQLAFTPNGKLLASCGGDDVVRTWELATGKVQHELRSHAESVFAVAFSPDGALLATGDGKAGGVGGAHVRLWETATGKSGRALTCSRAVVALAFAPSGKLLVSASQGDENRLWDVAAGEEVANLKLPRCRGLAVAFADTGATVTLGSHNQVWACDAATGKEVRCFPTQPPGDPHCPIAFSGDGRLAASGDERGTALLHDVATGKELHRVRAHAGPLAALALSPDGAVLATAGAFDNIIRLWDARTGKRRDSTPGHQSPVTSVAFHPDGRTVASADWDGTVRLWEASTGAEQRCLRAKNVSPARCIDSSPDGKVLAVGFDDGTISLWDPAKGEELRVLPPDGAPTWIRALAFAPDGKTLAAAGNEVAVCLWDVASGKRKNRQVGYNRGTGNSVEAVAFAPDGRTFMVQPHGAYVLFWDAAVGKEQAALGVEKTIDGVALSRDGRALAVTTVTPDGLAWQLWELATWQLRVSEIERGPRPRAAQVPIEKRVIFAPDGRRLALADPNGVVIVRDLPARRVLHRFTGHRCAVSSLAFAPDGRTLATACVDGTALIWNVPAAPDAAPPRLEARDLDALWLDLASEDAALAYRAMVRLWESRAQAVTFFRDHLRSPTDARRIDRFVRDLDADAFQERETATKELTAAGKLAEPALRRALDADPSVEARRRIQKILNKVPNQVIAPAEARAIRAVELLELLGDAEALAVLEPLARGAAEDRVTREAKASLERLQAKGGR